MKTKLNISKDTKFFNCMKSKVDLSGIAKQAAEARKFDNAISFEVESVEISTEWTGRMFEPVLTSGFTQVTANALRSVSANI